MNINSLDEKFWVKCPECGKNLFKATPLSAYNGIYIWCKSCKKEIYIKKRAIEPNYQK